MGSFGPIWTKILIFEVDISTLIKTTKKFYLQKRLFIHFEQFGYLLE